MGTTRVVSIPDIVVGPVNITTQNLVPAGVATANSAAELDPDGRSGLTIQVTGTYTGALSLQGTIDGISWITIGGTPLLNVNTGAAAANIASATQGIFQADCCGFAKVRVTALAAVTGTAIVHIRATSDPVSVAITRPLPNVTLSASSAGIGGVFMNPGATGSGYNLRTCVVSAATTNATLLKATQGVIGRIVASNVSAAVRYVSIFSKSTAPVTGTDTPIFKFAIPAGQTLQINLDAGMRIPTGIGFAITGGAALLDNTAVAAGDVILNIDYV